VESVDYWGGATVIKTRGDYLPLAKTSTGASHGSFIISNTYLGILLHPTL